MDNNIPEKLNEQDIKDILQKGMFTFSTAIHILANAFARRDAEIHRLQKENSRLRGALDMYADSEFI